MNNVPLALLVLRIGLAIFFAQWGVEKFVAPESTAGIFAYFYGMTIPTAVGYLFGAVEVILALCLAAGAFKTVAYGAATIIHAVSVVVAAPPSLGRPGQQSLHRRHAGPRGLRGAVPGARPRHALGALEVKNPGVSTGVPVSSDGGLDLEIHPAHSLPR